ncbi:MAG: hypothetical protein ACE5FT_04385 [Candidatus Nanoarchaeia archaeon]
MITIAKNEALAKMLNDHASILQKQLECAVQAMNGDNDEAKFFIDSAVKQNKQFTDFIVKKYGEK